MNVFLREQKIGIIFILSSSLDIWLRMYVVSNKPLKCPFFCIPCIVFKLCFNCSHGFFFNYDQKKNYNLSVKQNTIISFMPEKPCCILSPD